MIIAISSIVIMTYFGTLIYLVNGFRKLPFFNSETDTDKTEFTIIIPFRNEAEYLQPLLKSIFQLNYSRDKFEVLFVDDESEDNSVALISEALKRSDIRWSVLPNKRTSGSPKKDAISEAIGHSEFDWIVTTDADCVLPKLWLTLMDRLIRKQNPVMICAPVIYSSAGSNTILSSFQTIEGVVLQGVTMGCFGHGKPIMSNGANLAYKKNSFYEVGGFDGNSNIASGDDIFLMDKIRSGRSDKIIFLKNKEALVRTKTESSWTKVFQQRIRWASKTTKQNNSFSKFLAVIILLANMLIIFAPILAQVFSPELFWSSLIFFIFKIYADIIFFNFINDFFEIRMDPMSLIAVALIYPFIYSALAIRSLFGGYRWKGRQFSR